MSREDVGGEELTSLPDKRFFTIAEVHTYFADLALSTIYRWIERGELATVGPKHRQRVTRESLVEKILQFSSESVPDDRVREGAHVRTMRRD